MNVRALVLAALLALPAGALAHDAPHVQPEPAPAGGGAGVSPQELQQAQQQGGQARHRGGSCASCAVGSRPAVPSWLGLVLVVGAVARVRARAHRLDG